MLGPISLEVNWHSSDRVFLLLLLASLLPLLQLSFGHGLDALLLLLLLDDEPLVAVVLEVLAGAAAELLGTLAAHLKQYHCL